MPVRKALDSRDVRFLIAASEGYYDSQSDYVKGGSLLSSNISNEMLITKYLNQYNLDANKLFPIYSDKINDLDNAVSGSYLADFTTLNEIFNLIKNTQKYTYFRTKTISSTGSIGWTQPIFIN